MDKDQFLKEKGIYCPYCRSDNLDSLECFDGESWQMICEDCGGEYTEVYEMIDVDFVKLPE